MPSKERLCDMTKCHITVTANNYPGDIVLPVFQTVYIIHEFITWVKVQNFQNPEL